MNIITLSSVPPRFGMIGPTLESLLAQSAQIDRIILYIPRRYRRFPDYDGQPPKVPKGVEVALTSKDFGPATKLLPALRAFQGEDVNILFCDDDRIYQKSWAASLLQAGKDHPGCAITISMLHAFEHGADGYVPTRQPRAAASTKLHDLACRFRHLWRRLAPFSGDKSPHEPGRRLLKRSGYADIFEGENGVLVRPEFFDDLVHDIPDKLWAVDDVWLSGHVARRGVAIWASADALPPVKTPSHSLSPLHRATIDGLQRDAANAACIRYFRETYGIWV